MNARETFSKVEIEASEWLVAMHDRTVSLEERARLEDWLAADPEHERIYRIQKSAWSAIAEMPHLLDTAALPLPPSPRLPGTKHPKFLLPLAAAATLLLVLGAVFLSRWSGPGHAFETQTAQIKDIRLEDGTVVTLGAASRIGVVFTKSDRRVTLTGGEAFFEVTRDTARPFVVTAGDTQVRVLGTKFDVHYGVDAVRVAVLEGRVQVEHAATPKVLTAGESVVAPRAKRIAAVTHVDEPNVGAWRSGRLVYVDARLRDVIADVNRYYGGKIELGDAAAGNMQLTAAFRADQIDRMLEILTSALPVEAVHAKGGRIVLSSKAP